MLMKKTKWMSGVLFLTASLMIPTMAWAQDAAEKPAAKADRPASPTALLKAIPEDATAFVAIRSLDELDKDIIGVARSLGFPLGGQDGMFPGPLDWAKETTGLKDGVDVSGGVAIVVMNCREVQSVEGIGEKAALFLPATDPAALIKALGGEKSDGPAKVTFMGQDLQAIAVQKFVVLAQQEETIKAIASAKGEGVAKTMAPDRVKAFAERDIFAWVNFRGISPQIRDEVGNMLKGVLAMANQGDQEAAEKTLKQLAKAVDAAVEGSFAISLDQRGLTSAATSELIRHRKSARRWPPSRAWMVPCCSACPTSRRSWRWGCRAGVRPSPSRSRSRKAWISSSTRRPSASS